MVPVSEKRLIMKLKQQSAVLEYIYNEIITSHACVEAFGKIHMSHTGEIHIIVQINIK